MLHIFAEHHVSLVSTCEGSGRRERESRERNHAHHGPRGLGARDILVDHRRYRVHVYRAERVDDAVVDVFAPRRRKSASGIYVVFYPQRGRLGARDCRVFLQGAVLYYTVL